MSTVRPLTDAHPTTQAAGLLTLYRPFTERVRAVVQYLGSLSIPDGTTYSMGYVDDGMRGGGGAAPVLVRTTPAGSAILEEPVSKDTEREAYYRQPDTPALDDVKAFIADAPAIVTAVRQAAARDVVLSAALAQSPLQAPGRGGVTLA